MAGARVPRGREVVRELDIGFEMDSDPVAGHCRTARLAFGAARRRSIFGPAFRTCQRLGIRIEDQLVRVAVQNHQLPSLYESAGFVETDDGRNFQRARQNRGVIRAAAGVGRESADFGPIHATWLRLSAASRRAHLALKVSVPFNAFNAASSRVLAASTSGRIATASCCSAACCRALGTTE